MAQAAYEYECNRAELLGLEKPDYDAFCKEYEARKVVEEAVDTEHLKETEVHDETLNDISGGLEELNSILKSTQRHISNFKSSYGSFTSFLKGKLGRRNSTCSTASAASDRDEADAQSDQQQQQQQKEENDGSRNDDCQKEFVNEGFENEKDAGGMYRKSDLTKALDKHVNKLDGLIEKAENCQYSLRHQNKQMKEFLGN